MRLARVIVIGLALLDGTARANTVLQGLASLSAGYNSNPTATVVAQGDFFDDIRPGLRLTSLFARGLFFSQYTFDATLYLHRRGASGYSNDFSVGTLLLTSPTTTLTLGAGVLQSQFNNLPALQASATAPVLVVPAGTQQFVTTRLTESLTWDVTRAWHFVETSTFSTLIGLGQPNPQATYDWNTILEAGRRWQRDVLSLWVRLDYVSYPSTTPGGEVIGPQDQLLPATSVRWIHDFSPSFSTELMGGVLFALRAVETPGLFVEPMARAALHYRRQEGTVDLSYDHSAEPSLQTGITLIGDTLALRAALPLGTSTHMTLGASAAYQHANLLDFNGGNLNGSIDAWLADVGWNWAIWPEMNLFARYSFTDQIGATTTVAAIPTFMRHMVLVGVTITYPAVAAAPPNAFHGSVRADRSDAFEVPALHAPPQEPAPPH
jgi:hypothetical protein